MTDRHTIRMDQMDQDIVALARAQELTAGAGIHQAETTEIIARAIAVIGDTLNRLETRTEAAQLAVGALSSDLAELAARINTLEEDARRGRQI